MFTNPTIEEFENYYFRDFPFGSDPNEHIITEDIQKAFDQAECQINPQLFCSQKEYNTGYFSLAAHYLVLNIQASSQGISGRFEWATNSKSVGSVSVGNAIPSSITDNPQFAWLTTTNYGLNYLMIIYPRLHGNMFITIGKTQA